MVATLTTKPNDLWTGWAEPLYATQRTDRPTYGELVERVAVELGEPLMDWQREVAYRALEYDSVTGKPAYRTVTLTIPRQNGKTQLILSVMVARSLLWGSAQNTVFAAQTGKDVRGKWKKDLLPKIQGSPLKSLIKRAYMSDGDTNLLWKNGSRINMVDNTPTAGHGMTLDLVMLDEAMAHKDDTPETAFGSTIATRPFAQIWNVSTAGTPESTYLLQKVSAGRAAVNSGLTEGTAYFEWGVPEDEDPYDVEVLRNRFPAWGVTIDEEYVLWAQNEFSDGVYRRNIGNQWTDTEERVIPTEWWQAVAKTYHKADKPGVVAIDARADRSRAVIVRADANRNIQRVAVRPGVNWVVGEFFDKIPKTAPVAVAKSGPVSGVADDLAAAGYTVTRLDGLDVRKACTRFYDDIADNKLRVHKDDEFDIAVKSAVKRLSEDSWVWHRDAPGGDILMAASIAYAQAVAEDPGLVVYDLADY